jgi:hypothetical protein
MEVRQANHRHAVEQGEHGKYNNVVQHIAAKRNQIYVIKHRAKKNQNLCDYFTHLNVDVHTNRIEDWIDLQDLYHIISTKSSGESFLPI